MWRDDATLCGVPGREMTGKMVELRELCGVWDENMAPFGAYRWKRVTFTSCAGSGCGCSVWVVVVGSGFSPVILASTETGMNSMCNILHNP